MNRNSKSMPKSLTQSFIKKSPYNFQTNLKLQPLNFTKPVRKKPSQSFDSSILSSDFPSRARLMLEQCFLSNNIPAQLIDTYLDLFFSTSTKNAYNFILNEVQSIESGSSSIKSCLMALKSWEDSLGTIKEMAALLSENKTWIGMKDVVQQCAESLSAHVLLTLKMVESIQVWKDYLRLSFPENKEINFKYFDEDIYPNFKGSCNFLADSSLTDLFNIAKFDPFLISILKESAKGKKKSVFVLEKNRAFVLMNKEVIDRVKKAFFEVNRLETVRANKIGSLSLQKTIVPSPTPKTSSSRDIEGICKLFTERLVNEAYPRFLKEFIDQSLTEVFAQAITNKYIHNLNDLVVNIAKESISDAHEHISSQKSKLLMLSNIIENIFRNLVESEVNSLQLESFSAQILEEILEEKAKMVMNPEKKRRLTQIFVKIEIEKLAELIYHAIIEEFTCEDWLQSLAESNITITRKKTLVAPLVIRNSTVKIEEIEDNALEMFTPGIHSPNEISAEVSEEESDSLNTSVKMTPRITFHTKVQTVKDCYLKEICENSSKVHKILLQYYSNLPQEFQSFILDSVSVIKSAEEYLNPKFFWIERENQIFGLVVYSSRQSETVVHHLSCLDFAKYPDLIQNVLRLINLYENDLVMQFTETTLPAKVEKALKKNNFQPGPLNAGMREFHSKSKKTVASQCNSQLTASVILVTEENANINPKIVKEMIEVGNRHCLLSAVLSIYCIDSKIPVLFLENNIRLQQDLNEQLEILISLGYFNYPIISNYKGLNQTAAQKILIEKGIRQNLPSSGTFSLSLLNINQSMTGCSYVTKVVDNKKFKFLRFRSHKIVKKIENSTVMFIVPTFDEKISMFFIYSEEILQELNQGLKRGKTDLFYNMDNLIKALISEEQSPESTEFWVPCFKKQLEWTVPWIEGFKMTTPCNGQSISHCREFVCAEVNYSDSPNDTLIYYSESNFVFTTSFVYGVYHEDIKEKLDSPLFVSLIHKENWIA